LSDTQVHVRFAWKAHILLAIAYTFVAFAVALTLLTASSIDQRSLVPFGTETGQVSTALQNLSESERQALMVRERQRLVDAPLDRSALLNLSVLFALEGNASKSNELAVLAANRSLRDLPSQAAAMQLLLDAKQYSQALVKFDGVLRSSPERGADLYPLLLALSAQDAGLDAVTTVLSQMPPWRKSFMQFAARQPAQASELYKILSQLRKRNDVVTDDEMRPYLQYLMTGKVYDSAYFVWLDFLSPDDLRKVGLLYDGDFNLRPRNLFFDWNIMPAKNAEIGVVSRPGSGSNLALKLSFFNSKGFFSNVFQVLRLAEGEYSLQAEVRAEKLETPGGLMWQVSCVESNTVLGHGPKLNTAGPWMPFNFSFRVPAENCATQQLTLVTASPAILDQVISGQIYYDSFKLERMP
jgi:hypothetical protein